MEDKEVSLMVEGELFQKVGQFAKQNKIRGQSKAFIKLIELGLEGCPKYPQENKQPSRCLDDYFDYRSGTYVGPGGDQISFERQEQNEVETFAAKVVSNGSLIYTANRGRPIGSQEPIKFGSY